MFSLCGDQCVVYTVVMLTPPPQSDVHLIKKGEKVGASEATLLQMLKIFPFSYVSLSNKVNYYYHTHTVDHTVTDTAVLTDHIRDLL